jgi:serine protease Do
MNPTRSNIVLPQPGRRALVVAGAACLAAPSACSLAPSRSPPELVELIRNASGGVAGVADERGVVGTGFRVAGSHRLVTAAHLVSAPRGGLFAVSGAMRWPLKLLRVDSDHDLALLELPPDAALPGLELAASTEPRQGEWIVVLGRPFGAGTTATVGIVSALPGAVTMPATLARRLQLNVAVNPGNSGGPVLDLAGRVVGVVSAAVPGGSGLGFAAPAAEVARLANAVPGLAGPAP